MARKSRQHIIDTHAVTMQTRKVYNTAIYARLSIEDSGKQDTGDSIDNQIYLVKQYIMERPYLNLSTVYSDNGETGVNFDRPQFNEMMNAVKAGKIDCIVVKDLSRFGRNYIETGNYLEKIFPFLGVRFISVNDNYDTNSPDSNFDSLSISLKSLINDIYAKDISKKVTAALETKQKNGEFIGNYAAYGYMKSAEDRHRLVIDEEVATVVRDIFQWKSEGVGNNIIARRLNDLAIPSPNKYRYEKGLMKNKQYAGTLWTNSTIKSIIQNPVYTGCMSQGKKKTRLMQGVGPKKLTSDKWVNIENTHEAIIDKKLFDTVQELVQCRNTSYNEKAGKYAHIGNPENIFKGLVRCVDCGVNLSRYKKVKTNKTTPQKLYYFHVCPNYEKNQTRACKCRKSINEEVLIESVWESIQAQIDLCADTVELVRKLQKNSAVKRKVKTIKEQITEVRRKTGRIDTLLSSLYEDYAENILTESEYLFAKAKHREEKRLLQLKIDELIAVEAKHTETYVDENKWTAALLRFKSEKKLTADMLSELVSYIEVSGNNKVSVVFKYRDEYEALFNFIRESEVDVGV